MRLIEEAAAAGIHTIDFGKGAKHYKETLKSYDLFVAEGIVTRPSATAAVHWTRRAPGSADPPDQAAPAADPVRRRHHAAERGAGPETDCYPGKRSCLIPSSLIELMMMMHATGPS